MLDPELPGNCHKQLWEEGNPGRKDNILISGFSLALPLASVVLPPPSQAGPACAQARAGDQRSPVSDAAPGSDGGAKRVGGAQGAAGLMGLSLGRGWGAGLEAERGGLASPQLATAPPLRGPALPDTLPRHAPGSELGARCGRKHRGPLPLYHAEASPGPAAAGGAAALPWDRRGVTAPGVA